MRSVWRHTSLVGLFLTCLAFLGQLSGLSAPFPLMAGRAAIAGVEVGFCHAEAGGDQQAPGPRHTRDDCLLCPICLVVSIAAPTASNAPAVPNPLRNFIGSAVLL